jgi:hypothetical protein
MKDLAFIKTGLLPLRTLPRKLVAERLRAVRRNGWKLTRMVYSDAVVYQPRDPFSPYLYGHFRRVAGEAGKPSPDHKQEPCQVPPEQEKSIQQEPCQVPQACREAVARDLEPVKCFSDQTFVSV